MGMGELVMFTVAPSVSFKWQKKKKKKKKINGLDIGDRFPDIVAYGRWQLMEIATNSRT